MSAKRSVSPLIPLLILISFLTGCATYKQDINKSLDFAKKGQWQEAEKVAADVLDSSQDRLLRLMELGALAQYQGDYARSNQLLEEAEKMSDTFLKEGFANRSVALLTNARQAEYRASAVERIYINFFKSLNYLALAEQATTASDKRALQDAALVEARRIELKLNEINALTPSYEDIKGKNKAFYQRALSWLSGFYTGGIDRDEFIYRDDAWGRYMEGLQYEISGEYDDARIAYQRAAQLYDAGYSEQYRLPAETSQRAWLDVIRMMKKAGGWQNEYPALIEEKLNDEYQALLSRYDNQAAELVIIEEQGFVPPRNELNLMLYASPRDYSLVLEPVGTGTRREANNAHRWFSMVYADHGLLNLLANYKAGGVWSTVDGLFTKRIILGSGVWRQLESLSIDDMLYSAPVRVAVPYYEPFTPAQDIPTLTSSAKVLDSPVIRMTSVADIAIQEQLGNAHRDIYEALIKELVRNQLAYQVSNQVSDPTASLLLGFASKIAVTASVSAETRNWLTLPAQVRLVRQPVDAGTQSFTYQTQVNTFHLDEVNLKEDELKVWTIRNP